MVPTFNERENLPALVDGLTRALAGRDWELIVVDDDSPDGTAALARGLHAADGRVRLLRRIGRRGLSSACIEGMLASSALFLAVMDGDLQHDPALLPRMLDLLRTDRADVVTASRYLDGGDLGDWSPVRARISRLATSVTQRVTGVALTDPMSGYFAVRRELVDAAAPELSGLGFKILLDLILSLRPPVRIVELPLAFGVRVHGRSKLSPRVAWDGLLLLLDKTVGRWIPTRFIAFGLTGGFGVVVHMTVLWAVLAAPRLSFVAAQAMATATAMIVNYTINNLLTYADRSRRGWRWLTGLASFASVCGFGALANVGIAGLLAERAVAWPLAAMAGVAVSAVWNYAVTARYTWRQ